MANGQEVLNVILANEVRADLLTLFRKNPGLIDSMEGVARRIGRSQGTIQDDVAELVKLGMLRTRKAGSFEVIFLDRVRDQEIQNDVGAFLRELRPVSNNPRGLNKIWQRE